MKFKHVIPGGLVCLYSLLPGAEWKILPGSPEGVISLARVGGWMWMYASEGGVPGLKPRLLRFRQGRMEEFDSTHHASLNRFFWRGRLFSDGKAAYLYHAHPAFQTGQQEILRYLDGFSVAPMPGQLLHMDDTSAYTLDHRRINPNPWENRIVRWREGVASVVDTSPVSNILNFGFGVRNWIAFLVPDPAGGFWIEGTSSGDQGNMSQGLYRYNPRVAVASRWSRHDAELGYRGIDFSDGTLAVYGTAAVFDASGRLYVATTGGLFVREDGAFRNLTSGDSRISRWVVSVFADSKGKVWAGTGAPEGTFRRDSVFQVLSVLDGRVKIEKEFSLTGGLTGRVTDIKEDSLGNIWVSGVNIPVHIYNEDKVTGTAHGRDTRARARSSPALRPWRPEYRERSRDAAGRRSRPPCP